MDKPSKRRLAKDTLSSKENMESELNKKLPKPNKWDPVQSAPLTQEGFAPVEVQASSAPIFDGTSNLESSGFYPDEGYNYGVHYGGFQATRFNSSHVNDEEADARADFRYHRHHQTAHEAEAFVHPTTIPRERARHLRRSIAWSALWSAWSVIRRLPLLLRRHLRRSSTRLLARVSFFSLISLKF
jgi:hypothetical protein